MAESLSGSDLDDVIKHPQMFESSSSVSTVHSDQNLPDTKFPPFPSLKDSQPLTKTKKPSKDKEKVATPKRPLTSHRTLDYRKGLNLVEICIENF